MKVNHTLTIVKRYHVSGVRTIEKVKEVRDGDLTAVLVDTGRGLGDKSFIFILNENDVLFDIKKEEAWDVIDADVSGDVVAFLRVLDEEEGHYVLHVFNAKRKAIVLSHEFVHHKNDVVTWLPQALVHTSGRRAYVTILHNEKTSVGEWEGGRLIAETFVFAKSENGLHLAKKRRASLTGPADVVVDIIRSSHDPSKLFVLAASPTKHYVLIYHIENGEVERKEVDGFFSHYSEETWTDERVLALVLPYNSVQRIDLKDGKSEIFDEYEIIEKTKPNNDYLHDKTFAGVPHFIVVWSDRKRRIAFGVYDAIRNEFYNVRAEANVPLSDLYGSYVLHRIDDEHALVFLNGAWGTVIFAALLKTSEKEGVKILDAQWFAKDERDVLIGVSLEAEKIVYTKKPEYVNKYAIDGEAVYPSVIAETDVYMFVRHEDGKAVLSRYPITNKGYQYVEHLHGPFFTVMPSIGADVVFLLKDVERGGEEERRALVKTYDRKRRMHGVKIPRIKFEL